MAIIVSAVELAFIFDKQRRRLRKHNWPSELVVTSGGFDPINEGNVRCIQESATLKGLNGLLAVIVNSDNFLLKKQGFVFNLLNERLKRVSSIPGVDYVVPWDDDSQFISAALEIIRPTVFTKDGPRSNEEAVPEHCTCSHIGCHVAFSVGRFAPMMALPKT